MTFTDVTSQFTVNSTYVSYFKAYANATTVYVNGIIKAGTSDQNILVSAITASYRPKSVTYVAMPILYLNIGDATQNVVPYYVATGNGQIQVRCTSAIAGSSGVAFSGSWVRSV